MWGGSAAAALLVVAVAIHTDAGRRRLASVMQGAAAQPPSVPGDDERRRSLRDVEIENRKLADQIRALSQDRDRLFARMTVLERNYEDMTGSIARLGTSSSPEPNRAPASSNPASPEIAQTAPAPEQTLPLAAAPTTEPVDRMPARGEFGVDLGGAPSIAALRSAWERIRRHHPAQLEGLRAVIGVRDTRTGQVDLRLVVGPLGNAAAAARLCASFAAAGLSCQPAPFEGQWLALR